MTTSNSLTARPSLESLRKQASSRASSLAAGDAAASGRVRTSSECRPAADAAHSLRNS